MSTNFYMITKNKEMVLKYAPKLREALLCKKDCVLSADHFSKEFLNFTNLLSSEKEDLFNRRMEELKEKYQLPEKIEQWYDDAQTYGEQYIYIVPYKTEFERLLKKKANPLNMQSSYNTEQTISITEASVVHSNSPESKDVSHLIDLNNREDMHKINNVYFADNPLNLDVF